MQTLGRALGAALVLLALAAPAETQGQEEPLPPGPRGEILLAEQRRQAALVEADVAVLQEVLADELRYVHADGRVESKYELIASLESGRVDYLALRARDLRVRALGEAGVVTGTATQRVRVTGGREQKLHLHFTAVYAKQGGAWRLQAYQSTRAADAP